VAAFLEDMRKQLQSFLEFARPSVPEPASLSFAFVGLGDACSLGAVLTAIIRGDSCAWSRELHLVLQLAALASSGSPAFDLPQAKTYAELAGKPHTDGNLFTTVTASRAHCSTFCGTVLQGCAELLASLNIAVTIKCAPAEPGPAPQVCSITLLQIPPPLQAPAVLSPTTPTGDKHEISLQDEFQTSPAKNTLEARALKEMDALKALCEQWKTSGRLPAITKENFSFLEKSTSQHAVFAQALCRMLKQYARGCAYSTPAPALDKTARLLLRLTTQQRRDLRIAEFPDELEFYRQLLQVRVPWVKFSPGVSLIIKYTHIEFIFHTNFPFHVHIPDLSAGAE
jgi:hypothetical protein